jgi:glycogen operon protein
MLMTDADWQNGFARSLGVFLNGSNIPTPDRRGEPIVDDSFYLLFNAWHEPLDFRLPANDWGERWRKVIDTNDPVPDLRDRPEVHAGDNVTVQGYAMIVLKRIDQ